MRKAFLSALSALLLSGIHPSLATAAQVSLRGSEILVDGKPFVPMGASGVERLVELKALGPTCCAPTGRSRERSSTRPSAPG